MRAFAGWPGTQAMFWLGSKEEGAGKLVEMRITKTRVVPSEPRTTDQQKHSSNPVTGYVDVSSSEGLIVTCGNDTYLEVLELQPAGRGVMSAAAYKHGLKSRQIWVRQDLGDSGSPQ